MTIPVEANFNIQLAKGQAIVICGPPRSGKTVLAKSLAHKSGGYLYSTMEDLRSGFGLARVCQPDIKTVIVDGFDATVLNWEVVKSLATEEKVMVERKGQDPAPEELPNFIFCTNTSPTLLRDVPGNFIIIKLGE